MDIREVCDSKLATSAAINLAVEAETVLFTVPAGKICIITKVVMRSPSAQIDQASISFGFNTANADDVIADGVIALTDATSYEVIPVASDAQHGVAAGTFKLDVNTAEGAADTAVFDVFGYLFDA